MDTSAPNPRELAAARKVWSLPTDSKVIVEVIKAGEKPRTIEGNPLGVGDYLAMHTIEHDSLRILVHCQ